MTWLFLSFPWKFNTKSPRCSFLYMVIFYLLCLYRLSGHIIVAIIAPMKKNCSSFLLVWGKMALTLLMLRYMSYKFFIVYFSLCSSVHCLSCLTLHCILFCFQKMKSVLMVRSMNWKKRRAITLEWQMQKERGELVWWYP